MLFIVVKAKPKTDDVSIFSHKQSMMKRTTNMKIKNKKVNTLPRAAPLKVNTLPQTTLINVFVSKQSQ